MNLKEIKGKRKFIGAWCMNILIAIDQLGNAIIFGDPDETISSRLGKFEIKKGGKISKIKHPFSAFLAWGLDKIDPNHCYDAIEKDEGSNQIILDN